MELKSLYTVKKIIETGSYLNASKALNYAQSTITFQVKQLEAELDVQIFEKRGNKMALTQEGERLIPLIDNVIASGGKEGMCTMDQSIVALFREGLVSRETALEYATHPEQIARQLG